jgi:LuxR family quorum sensing-dependent transcriptional regulator
MTQAIQAFGQEAFDFIEHLNGFSSADEVADGMNRVIARFGFEGLFFGGLQPKPGQSFDDLILAARCPAEFLALYVSRDYVHFDANIRRARCSTEAFEWSATPNHDDDVTRMAEIKRLLADFQYLRGLFVPLHGPGGFVAAAVLAGSKIDLSAKNKPGLHLLSLYAFGRIRQLSAAKPEAKPKLTTREREVLAWSAQGKSAWEIGEILNIAKRTVDEHAQTAMRKLGAANRTQAVAIAILHRLFDI